MNSAAELVRSPSRWSLEGEEEEARSLRNAVRCAEHPETARKPLAPLTARWFRDPDPGVEAKRMSEAKRHEKGT